TPATLRLRSNELRFAEPSDVVDRVTAYHEQGREGLGGKVEVPGYRHAVGRDEAWICYVLLKQLDAEERAPDHEVVKYLVGRREGNYETGQLKEAEELAWPFCDPCLPQSEPRIEE